VNDVSFFEDDSKCTETKTTQSCVKTQARTDDQGQDQVEGHSKVTQYYTVLTWVCEQ